MPSAVVTGPFKRAADMALVLKLAGYEVLIAEPEVVHIPPDVDEVDCYVQFPDEASPGVDSPGRAHVRTLAARFDAAARVAPMLARGATVVLVADPPDVTPAPEVGLMRLLIEAIIADHGNDAVRIAVVDGARPNDEIVTIAQAVSRSI